MGQAGPVANAAELLHSHCWPEWIAQMRNQYDQVVIDAPAWSQAADALIAAGAADGMLLVATVGAPRTSVTAALDALAPLRQRLVGAILVRP
jgi:Mrp family chromosome partitioning ATPase